MEIDTGAAVSVISQKILRIPVQQSSKQLRSATGQILELAGEAKVKAQVKGKREVVKYIYRKRGVPCIIWQRLDQYLFW